MDKVAREIPESCKKRL